MTMKKRILSYRRNIDAILDAGGAQDWERLRAEHLVQISFFQHERLIHLIVTALFGLIEVIAMAMTVLVSSLAVLVLCFALLALLVPYICHYYLLENEVQRLYTQYDRIERQCEACRTGGRTPKNETHPPAALG